jgi:hypothetical protein
MQVYGYQGQYMAGYWGNLLTFYSPRYPPSSGDSQGMGGGGVQQGYRLKKGIYMYSRTEFSLYSGRGICVYS